MKVVDWTLWGFGALALIVAITTSPEGLAWIFGAFFFASTVLLRRWARGARQGRNQRQLRD